MLKEEREFREWLYTTLGGPDKLASKKITALRRAIYKDAAKVCEKQGDVYRFLAKKEWGGMVDADQARIIASDDCAALIRGKGEGK